MRYVKHNLNKPLPTLEAELCVLRPNNNDLSVMSVIQARRQTLAQSKPGLVVVALEEVPADVEDEPAAGAGTATGRDGAAADAARRARDAIEQAPTLGLIARRSRASRRTRRSCACSPRTTRSARAAAARARARCRSLRRWPRSR